MRLDTIRMVVASNGIVDSPSYAASKAQDKSHGTDAHMASS